MAYYKGMSLAVVLLCLATLSHAEDCIEMRGALFDRFNTKYVVLQQLYTTSCYGSKQDDTDWVKSIRKQKPAIAPNASSEVEYRLRKQWSIAVFNDLLDATQALDFRVEVRKEFESALSAASKQLSVDGPIEGVTEAPNWRLQGGSGELLTVPSLRLKETVDQACGQGAGPPVPESVCAQSIAYAEHALRIIFLAQSALQYHDQPVIEAYAQRYTLREKMWDAYLDNAHPQFQWEWALNSWRMERSDDRPLDKNGQPMGPMEIPTDQIILLHPAIGIERLDLESSGATTDPTLYVEFIGYNRWSWNKDAGEMKNALGLSLIGSLASRDDADDFSYGLMFHLKNTYSIAVTKNDDGTGLLLGIDLAEMFRDKLNKAKKIKFW